MNALNRTSSISTAFALGFIFLNFINLVAWVLGFYVPPVIYLLAMLAYVPVSVLNLKRDWMIVALFSCFILIILGAPLFDWDARYIWFFHAKRIFIDNNLYAQLDNYFWEIHNDYPVLVPAIAASFAKGVGFWNEVFPRLSIIPVLFPIFLVLSFLFKRTENFGFAVIGVLFISKQILVNGYMDAILGLYGAAACLLVVKLDSEGWDRRAYFLLVSILLSLPMIKNEGVLISLLICASLIGVFWEKKAALVLPALTFVIYYYLWKRHVKGAGIETTDLFVSGILKRAVSRLSSSEDVLEIAKWVFSVSGIYFLTLILFMKKFWKSLKQWRSILFFVLSYSCAMIAIYLITTLDLKEHLSHSVDRTFLVVNLSIFLMLLKCYDRRGSQTHLSFEQSYPSAINHCS
ncbi:MAG: hypothetical protein EBQ92_07200 [Proteobacteria bacterium]|nr:hypothetical protein [Pseudomonadota bacterium]